MVPAPSILDRCPGSLSLPTVDPHALSVEALLRFSGVCFIKKDAPMHQLKLSIPTVEADDAQRGCGVRQKSGHTEYKGFGNCVEVLKESLPAKDGFSDINPTQACIEALTVKCLFPAFVFLVHFDPRLYQYAIKKSVMPKVSTLWESMWGSYRCNVLHSNIYFYSGGRAAAALPTSVLSLADVTKMEEVLVDADKALRSLEQILLARENGSDSFLLGTSTPGTADAYLYAAASSFLHADFGGPHGSHLLQNFQQTMRVGCPQLVKYVERLRYQFFEDYKGTYYLRPLTTLDPTNALEGTEDLYVKGRLQTLLLTGGFACAYFVMVNADLMLALLEWLVVDEVDQGEAVDREDNGGDVAPGTAQQASE